MKRVLIALSIMALASPAIAAPVRGSDGPAPPTESQNRAAARKAKEDERAYKDALERIPTSSKKQDPWDKMR
ncbi:hypothetical protein JQ557_17775 [Bradyrhizobium sp. U87765 SZCCT0131]|uniref:hypothetical protein n=1 Tax=unclassified Bradyrhizobium TaxID=2631580 RepID=UPI001BADBEC8|nr:MULTISPECIES: hypothetical protein [unclassified Bradyrhizobium]MBR1219862.1 hypothetical protein [Bradyrhizobium sp. U87765 SZCCT0131]MBR1262513.1 hypothetical protein [Bradyrhizobium sp. U87765 SZCCT0134]MBR1308304.1 hypothetical protein [Bradyrhizobium sp. U87765 SZCCT0110]MBR1318295.1 hypothetical protein [Bradyrhizobium sp. U87765 SZCCT0109]MBR1351998.1 hypothetical protein [Bradyrhizobium sp. U87765 SZCCT0048]